MKKLPFLTAALFTASFSFCQTLDVLDDLSWASNSPTTSGTSPNFAFCNNSTVNYSITTSLNFARINNGQGNGILMPSPTSTSGTSVTTTLNFSQGVDNLRIYMVDLDFNTSPSYANPEEFISNISMIANGAALTPVPNIVNTVGTNSWNSTLQRIEPSTDNSEYWMDFVGLNGITQLQFNFNRPGAGFGLIIDSVGFDCHENMSCVCPANVHYNQIGQISNSGAANGNLVINSMGELISSLTLELPYYQVFTEDACRLCDVDNIDSYGIFSAIPVIAGVTGIPYAPGGGSGVRKINYTFPSPITLNEIVGLNLLFPPSIDLSCCKNRVEYCINVTLRKSDCTSCEYNSCSDQDWGNNNQNGPGNQGNHGMVSDPFNDGPIDELTEIDELGLEVSPNPTSQIIRAKINAQDFNKGDAFLFNESGMLVQEQTIRQSSFTLNSVPPGRYLLTVVANGKKSTKQVVVL